VIRVVAGVFQQQRRDATHITEYLVARRRGPAFAGCWEFPGGKQDPGDVSDQHTLRREWREELNACPTEIGRLLYEREHPVRDGGPFTLAAYEIRHLVHDGIGRAFDLDAHDMLWYAQIDEIMALSGDQVTPSLKPITSKFLPGGDALSLITAALRGVTVDIDVRRGFYDLRHGEKDVVIGYRSGSWGVSPNVADSVEVFHDAEHAAWRAIELLG